MKNIIKTLINEGVETKDILNITKYLMEAKIYDFGKHKKAKDAENKLKDTVEASADMIYNNANHCRMLPNGEIMGPAKYVVPMQEVRNKVKKLRKQYQELKDQADNSTKEA